MAALVNAGFTKLRVQQALYQTHAPATAKSKGARSSHTIVNAASVPEDVLDKLFEQLKLKPRGESVVDPFDAARAPALRSELFEHQAVAVAWMLNREQRPDSTSANGLPAFWEKRVEAGAEVYFNTITNSSSTTKPVPVRGGVLADDMGLGKSIQMLAVLLANPPAHVVYVAPEPSDAVRDGDAEVEAEAGDDLESLSLKQCQARAAKLRIPTTGTRADLIAKIRAVTAVATELASSSVVAAAGGRTPAIDAAPRTTLIVCPVSVIGGWEDQIAQHVHTGVLRVHIYNGNTRNSDPKFLATQDVVLISYAQVLCARVFMYVCIHMCVYTCILMRQCCYS